MNVNAVRRVREVIGSIAFAEAQILATEVEAARTSEEAEAVLVCHIQEKWPDLLAALPRP